MKPINLPSVGARYWAALMLASILGATIGDYLADDLGLGFITGVPFMLGMLVALLFAERRLLIATQLYYWGAEVISRAASTNLADLFTHQLKLGYIGVGIVLTALLTGTLLFAYNRRQSRAANAYPESPAQLTTLPSTDSFYWIAMLIASTLGTAMGDFAAGRMGLGLGVGLSSLIFGSLVLVALYARSKFKVAHVAYYWFIVVLIRTAGTNMGDYIAGHHGLNLGDGFASVIGAVVLIAALLFWRDKKIGIYFQHN